MQVKVLPQLQTRLQPHPVLAATFDGGSFPFGLNEMRSLDVAIGDDMLVCIDALRWAKVDLFNLVSAFADELDAIRVNQNERSAKLQAAYDYGVVGTGSAACALVGRLATRKDASILMFEAGDWDVAPSVMDPGVWLTNLGSERDWKDVALAAPSTNNRAIPEHMGRVVGGGSSINATIWARPFKADLEFWAEAMRIESGSVHVNGFTVQNEAQAPYGGTKNSGYGKFDGRAVIDEFTELKWITIEPSVQNYPV